MMNGSSTDYQLYSTLICVAVNLLTFTGWVDRWVGGWLGGWVGGSLGGLVVGT